MSDHPRPAARLRRLRTVVVSTALAFSFAAGSAVAASAAPARRPPGGPGSVDTFGIKPSHATLKAPIDTRSRFDYEATAGAQATDYVAISNDALTPVHLSVYASDGFNTGSDGFDLLPADRKPVDVGAWVHLKTNAVDIPAKGTVVVPFTFTVPAKVTPGDHVGGIVASLQTAQLDKKGDKIITDHRVGTRIYLRIQGALDPRLAVTGLRAKYHGSWWNPFGSGRVTVSWTVDNPGNVRLGAHESIDVSGAYGAVHSATLPDLAELLPDNAHQQSITLHGVTPSFQGKARLEVDPVSLPGDTDGRTTDVIRTVHFSAVPWGLLLLMALVLLLPIGWLTVLRRRRRAGSSARPATQAQPKTVGVQP